MDARQKMISVLLTLAFSAAACTLTQPSAPTVAPVSTIPPVEQATLTPTEVPLYEQVRFTTVSASESNDAPKYTITTETPTLEGVDDGRVLEFNVSMQMTVNEMVNGFKDSMKDQPATPIVAGSSFDVKYELLSPSGYIYSVKFNVMGYTDGAAHPYHFSKTVTFNLETGKEVTLDKLFLPGSNYLQILSDISKTDLSARDIGFDPTFFTGADPTPENYKSWNITADGLLITFDEYQVAAYAAGPQTVTIPYSALKDIIDPNGLLGKYIQ
ncbi:MAG: DUF3298 domain-containing protein [Chloroflexi bacterium]|nr:DUF3298 domain-containing protein [Chloroflexota bacterium]